MKHKLLTFALMGAFASTMLFSCKNAEEPIPSPGDNNSGEMVEYSISVNVPDEFRTRDAATASVGESGLYEFENRTIDKLWYAVYYDGNLKSSSYVTRDDTNPFIVTTRITGSVNPDNLYFFFWAGGQGDSVNSNYNVEETGVPSANVGLNFSKKFVAISPLGYNKSNFQVYDSFAGYYQYSAIKNKDNGNGSVILKRPFAQVHILTDDFSDTDLYKSYESGFTTITGFGTEKVNKNTLTDQTLIPTVWYFDPQDSKEYYFKESSSNLWTFTFTNKLDQVTPERVTFKEREMDYLSCFYVFAPNNPDDSNFKDYNIMNIAVFSGTRINTEGNKPTALSDTKYISIPMPENGFKANNRYVIYNKKRSEGGTGFLEGYYDYQILVDNDGSWEDPDQAYESDRL